MGTLWHMSIQQHLIGSWEGDASNPEEIKNVLCG